MRPYQLVRDRFGEIKETISHPFESGLYIKIRDPGNPNTMTNAKVADLTLVIAHCPGDDHEWEARIIGEYNNSHIKCPQCSRKYYAQYEYTEFFYFESEPGHILKFVPKEP